MKVALFIVCALLLFAAVVSWPAVKADVDWWKKERHYRQLHVGETRAKVRATFGLPEFTDYSDECWNDRETLWPRGQRLYTLCFERGRLSSKSYTNG